jgi:hypothetical protein
MRGAASLSLHFDADCSTNTETLHLLTHPNPVAVASAVSASAASQQQHVPTPLTGSDGHTLSFSGRNFPRLPLWISGDSVTFVLERGKSHHHHHHAPLPGESFGTASASSGILRKHDATASQQQGLSLASLMPGMPWRWRCTIYECFDDEPAVNNWLLGMTFISFLSFFFFFFSLLLLLLLLLVQNHHHHRFLLYFASFC